LVYGAYPELGICIYSPLVRHQIIWDYFDLVEDWADLIVDDYAVAFW
tara:strand:+ start:40 stop:180 length:141 start_codon:yes stop_codon:yes gene_type:complete